jgi:carbamoyltransferase
MDLAASIQKVTEEIMMRCAEHVHRETGMKNLCLAGGVALNCVGNGRILREGPFENIWIQPAAGDAGGALGVALFIWHQLLDQPRTVERLDRQHGSLLGPRFETQDIRSFLERVGAPYKRFEQDAELCAYVATQIASEKVVGWCQGRMEFGPRALGSRSILGDARSEGMQRTMNVKIKFRESFRPFAPSVLQERVDEYFKVRPQEPSPYMLLTSPVNESIRLTVNGSPLTGIDKLKLKRSTVPAITHVDYSARMQTVDKDRHGRYYRLLKEFESLTGCPVIINTSFNVRGEPIVCRPEEAYRCFLATDMDVLVLEDCVLHKEDQPESARPKVEEYLAQFKLD